MVFVLILFLVSALYGQAIQQEFLAPSKVRKPYKHKEFKSILFSDDEVFVANPGQLSKEFIEKSGYRIQLISTPNLAEAIRIKAQADSLYSIPVYVDFEPPNYKVRIGNYLTNEDAEGMQQRLQQSGFKTAWVVPSKIIVVK